jgi:NADH:ubiquinone oxidoreductase subunit E
LLGKKKENISVVSIMPCTAKKFEAKRDEFVEGDIHDVDHVLTTTEVARMIREMGLQFKKLTPESFDLPLGFKTGAGVIFGNSGGVSEAVLRYSYEKLSGEQLMSSDFPLVRGAKGVREANFDINGTKLKLGIVHSLKNARQVCEDIMKGVCDYDLIEVMACPGGCIDGGGQPVSFDPEFRQKRSLGLYNCDKQLQLHKPQENPYVKELYDNSIGEVGGETAHDWLHTHYHGRKRIVKQTLNIRNTSQAKIEVCVCVGTNCFLKGSQELLKQLMQYVSDNKLEDLVGFEGQEEMVDVKATFCFERCDRGPVVRVNNNIIEKAGFEEVKRVLDKEIERIGQSLLVL